DTDAAVRSFQDATGLPPIGVAGPQTKQALYAPRTATNRPAEPACTLRSCAIHLSRGTTRDLADAFPDGELARSILANGISIVACARVKAIPTLNVVCQAIGS